jgi:YidC/Oxa1 family membrane protein insertase
LAIILLTLLLRLLLYPLSAKQARSARAMQELQPEIKALQAKYKDDRQKVSEETMKLYKERKVNPLSGCLPLIVQLPLLIGLYSVFRTPVAHLPNESALFEELCGTPSAFMENATSDQRFEVLEDVRPDQTDGIKSVDEFSALKDSDDAADQQKYAVLEGRANTVTIQDLEKAREDHTGCLDKGSKFLGVLNLSLSASQSEGSAGDRIPAFLLVALVTGTAFYQQRQTMGRRTAEGAQQMPGQAALKFMPLFMGYIAFIMPSGVCLYFLTTNLFQIGQQAYIYKQMDAESASRGKS